MQYLANFDFVNYNTKMHHNIEYDKYNSFLSMGVIVGRAGTRCSLDCCQPPKTSSIKKKKVTKIDNIMTFKNVISKSKLFKIVS